LEYIDNIKISDSEPKSYYTEIKSKYYSNKELILENALKEHGIPEDFYEMEYSVFLTERRKKIAMLIKEMYSNI